MGQSKAEAPSFERTGPRATWNPGGSTCRVLLFKVLLHKINPLQLLSVGSATLFIFQFLQKESPIGLTGSLPLLVGAQGTLKNRKQSWLNYSPKENPDTVIGRRRNLYWETKPAMTITTTLEINLCIYLCLCLWNKS